MKRRNRHRVGWGLLAAAAVLLVAFLVREVNDEPAGAVLVFAVLFGVLGLKAFWRSSGGEPPAAG